LHRAVVVALGMKLARAVANNGEEVAPGRSVLVRSGAPLQ
jgi:hypothetical protein